MRAFLALIFTCVAATTFAQGAEVPFGGLIQDPSLPVDVTADQLSIDQTDSSATFTGNVVVTQGAVKLTAATIRVVYAPEVDGQPAKIAKLEASGGVVLISGEARAEAIQAEYDINTGNVLLSGGVNLLQGPTSVSGDRMTVNLTTGTGRIEGNVRTTLTPVKKP